MSEPITIGDQTFINDPDRGWIDRKTKLPADKSLIKLLDSLELKPVEKKLRVKIDRRVEPVTINGQKFVYDGNALAWIDEKTKVRAADSLQKTLNSVVKVAAFGETSGEVEKAYGTIGQIAKTNVKVKTPELPRGTGARPSKLTVAKKPVAQKTNQSKLINPVIVNMVSILASIDDTIKQQLEQKKQLDRQDAEQNRENEIESNNALANVEKQHATRIKAKNGLLAGAGGLLLMQYFDPIMTLVTDVGEVVYDMAKYTFDALGKMADWLGWFNKSGGLKPAPASKVPAIPVKPEPYKAKPSDWTKPSTGPLKEGLKPAVKPVLAPRLDAYKSTGKPIPMGIPLNQDVKQVDPELFKKSAKPQTASAAPAPSGLHPAVRNAFIKANAEYREITGQNLPVTSKRRSYAVQQELYARSIKQGHPGWIVWPSGRKLRVAKPGTSTHERGTAVDIIPNPTAVKILNKYGLYQTDVGGDEVHFELKGPGAPPPLQQQTAQPMPANKPSAVDKVVEAAKTTMTNILNPQLTRATNIASMNTVASAETIRKSAVEKTADEVGAVQPYVPPPAPPPSMPNLNASKPNYGIKTPAAPEDKKILANYLIYMNVLPVQTTQELML